MDRRAGAKARGVNRHEPPTTVRLEALRILLAALTDERAMHEPDSPAWRALSRAMRATYTAIRAARGEPL